MESAIDLVITIGQFLSLVCDIIILLLPWMILASIKAVRASVDAANANRTRESKAILNSMKQLHNDLLELGGRGDEIEP